MSFVAIREEKNPVEMHNQVYEASKNNALTPEVCMEILSHTNVPVIMKEMLEKIEKLPVSEQAQYKEIILSMFDYRQTSEKVRGKALEMAKNLGFDSELNKVIKETGEGGYSARNGVKDEMYVIDKAGDYRDVDFSSYKGVIVKGEIEEKIKFGGEFLRDYPNHTLSGVLDLRGAKKVDLTRCDLSKVTKIIFKEGAVVNLVGATNLPKNLDVSMCDKVDLRGCDFKGVNELKFKEGAEVSLWGAKNLPSNLDVSMCDKVDLSQCVLDGLNLKFKEGAVVILDYAKNLPTDLDVSMCDVVTLRNSDLRGVNELKFRKGAKVSLSEATNLPKDLDVSMCDEVSLNGCDLKRINLKFRKGATVYLNEATNLPKDLDVSMCDKVDLRGCDFKGVNELKFREGAVVNLEEATNLPKDLDVSMCGSVLFSGLTVFGVMYADISNVKELKFKNEEQMKDSQVKIPEDWGGKIIYTDDEKQMPVISKGNDGR